MATHRPLGAPGATRARDPKLPKEPAGRSTMTDEKVDELHDAPPPTPLARARACRDAAFDFYWNKQFLPCGFATALLVGLSWPLPGRFLGAVPVYGLPLLGYLAGSNYELLTRPAEIARTSVFALHDRSDEARCGAHGGAETTS